MSISNPVAFNLKNFLYTFGSFTCEFTECFESGYDDGGTKRDKEMAYVGHQKFHVMSDKEKPKKKNRTSKVKKIRV